MYHVDTYWKYWKGGGGGRFKSEVHTVYTCAHIPIHLEVVNRWIHVDPLGNGKWEEEEVCLWVEFHSSDWTYQCDVNKRSCDKWCIYPPLNYWNEIPESKLVNATEGGCQKERYCDDWILRNNKRLMIHDINIIVMIESCQEMKAGWCGKNYMQAFIKMILCTISIHPMVILRYKCKKHCQY